jgi:hypothetical protein
MKISKKKFSVFCLPESVSFILINLVKEFVIKEFRYSDNRKKEGQADTCFLIEFMNCNFCKSLNFIP